MKVIESVMPTKGTTRDTENVLSGLRNMQVIVILIGIIEEWRQVKVCQD
jgi:hypothetical protein